MPTYAEITREGSRIKIKFNDLATLPKVGTPEATFSVDDFTYIRAEMNYSHLDVYINGSGEYQLDMNGVEGLPVATVGTDSPANNTDLLAKLNTLIS